MSSSVLNFEFLEPRTLMETHPCDMFTKQMVYLLFKVLANNMIYILNFSHATSCPRLSMRASNAQSVSLTCKLELSGNWHSQCHTNERLAHKSGQLEMATNMSCNLLIVSSCFWSMGDHFKLVIMVKWVSSTLGVSNFRWSPWPTIRGGNLHFTSVVTISSWLALMYKLCERHGLQM